MKLACSKNQLPQWLDTCAALAVSTLAMILGREPFATNLLSLRALGSLHFALSDAGLGVFFALIWLRYAGSNGLTSNSRGPIAPRISRLFACSLGMTVLFGAYISLVRKSHPSIATLALFLAFALACGMVALMISRLLVRPKRVIILGSGRLATKAWREIRTRDQGGRQLVGFVDVTSRAEMAPDIADRYLGDVDQLAQLMAAEGVDELIAAVPLRLNFDVIQYASSISRAFGTRVIGLKDAFGISCGSTQSPTSEIFVELVPSPCPRGLRQELKRAFNVIIAAAGAVIALPLILAVVLYSKLRSDSPTSSQTSASQPIASEADAL